jgi:hypothetical protein
LTLNCSAPPPESWCGRGVKPGSWRGWFACPLEAALEFPACPASAGGTLEASRRFVVVVVDEEELVPQATRPVQSSAVRKRERARERVTFRCKIVVTFG